MHWSLWCLFAFLAVFLFALSSMLVCFFMAFYSPKRKPLNEDDYDIPGGEIYQVHKSKLIEWTKKVRAMPHEAIEITSFDGLTLRGRYYEYKPGAPVEILFHGYRGSADRDLCGAVERAFRVGRSALIVNQRGSGTSDGHVITFGIKERRDCLTWIKKVIEIFGDDVKIVITGVSMGAATVMMAAGEDLPKNVISVLADCGYTSPKEIICKVMRDMHLPPALIYPFDWLAARVFGRFNLNEASAIEAMKRCKIPTVFIHGDADDFVPYEMSVRLYEACASEKKVLITATGSGHCLAYLDDPDEYVRRLNEIYKEWKI